MPKAILTVWEAWDYDVWGNAEEGYDVNNRFRIGEFEENAAIRVYNAGTEHEFRSAELSDDQIRDMLGIRAEVPIETDGDDMVIYVTAEENGYPLGELHCLSHVSLSPPRLVEDCQHSYRYNRTDDHGNVLAVVCGERNCYHAIEKLYD